MGPVDHARFEESQNMRLRAVISQLVECYYREREQRIQVEFEAQKNGEEAIRHESLRGLCKRCLKEKEEG